MTYRPISSHSPAGILLDRIYMRRLQWQADRQAILSPALSQPRLNVVLDIQHSPSPRNPYLLEVTLFLNARCDNADALVFETKIQYTGLYRIESPDLASDKSVIDFCAAQIYPHLRREFANRTLLGGFQGLLLHDRHLETCLQRLFMGATVPKADFVRIFGTLFNRRSQNGLPKNARSGPPARVRIASRRILRSPWLLPALSVPIITSLLGGIHWWMDHRQPEPAPKLALVQEKTLTSSPVTAPNQVETPAPDAPSPASKQLASIGVTGAEWLKAQPASNYTIVLVRAQQPKLILSAAEKLTMDQPAFMLRMNDEVVVVSGSFAQKQEATNAADRLKKAHKGMSTSVVSLSALKPASN